MAADEVHDDNLEVDVDELIHRDANADAPAAMPPDREEDFEKAFRRQVPPPTRPRIIPNNPD